ncbi:MAG: hypothetical protein JWO86_4498 [Myxococcaceae bacterium]|nr:hypothetical protein [Myxococcaceae bacterium]
MRSTQLQRLGLVFLTAAGVSASAACDAPSSSDGASAGVESRWGFLDDASLTPDAPQFLVNKVRGAKFRVCVPRYMADALPGIESEVYAAVNVWASYVGRVIPVEIETKDLPRGRADQSIDDLAASYQAACGEGFDVVMGLGKLEGSAVGLTGASYRYLLQPDGSRQITSFTRYLFLRDYDLVPTIGSDGNAERWTSLAAQDGTPISGPDLLASMLTRTKTRYASASTYLVLPVLTHEYGHVWGLCDQYEGSTNCDPHNSSSHPVDQSIMGARGGTQRLFLTDDDIEGVRTLAHKPGFAHDWGPPHDEPPAAIPHKPVELARIDNVRRQGSTLVVTYGVVTSGAARYGFELQAEGEASFTPLTSDFGSTEPFDVPTGELTITLQAASTHAYRVRLTVTPKVGSPVVVLGAEH